MKESKSSLKISLEVLLPILDLYISLIYRMICGPQNIDLQAYIQQSNYYLDDPEGANYKTLRSECGPVAYPGAAVYFYSLVNILSGRNVTWNFGQIMHIVFDVFRMYLLVKIYKIAMPDIS